MKLKSWSLKSIKSSKLKLPYKNNRFSKLDDSDLLDHGHTDKNATQQQNQTIVLNLSNMIQSQAEVIKSSYSESGASITSDNMKKNGNEDDNDDDDAASTKESEQHEHDDGIDGRKKEEGDDIGDCSDGRSLESKGSNYSTDGATPLDEYNNHDDNTEVVFPSPDKDDTNNDTRDEKYDDEKEESVVEIETAPPKPKNEISRMNVSSSSTSLKEKNSIFDIVNSFESTTEEFRIHSFESTTTATNENDTNNKVDNNNDDNDDDSSAEPIRFLLKDVFESNRHINTNTTQLGNTSTLSVGCSASANTELVHPSQPQQQEQQQSDYAEQDQHNKRKSLSVSARIQIIQDSLGSNNTNNHRKQEKQVLNRKDVDYDNVTVDESYKQEEDYKSATMISNDTSKEMEKDLIISTPFHHEILKEKKSIVSREDTFRSPSKGTQTIETSLDPNYNLQKEEQLQMEYDTDANNTPFETPNVLHRVKWLKEDAFRSPSMGTQTLETSLHDPKCILPKEPQVEESDDHTIFDVPNVSNRIKWLKEDAFPSSKNTLPQVLPEEQLEGEESAVSNKIKWLQNAFHTTLSQPILAAPPPQQLNPNSIPYTTSTSTCTSITSNNSIPTSIAPTSPTTCKQLRSSSITLTSNTSIPEGIAHMCTSPSPYTQLRSPSSSTSKPNRCLESCNSPSSRLLQQRSSSCCPNHRTPTSNSNRSFGTNRADTPDSFPVRSPPIHDITTSTHLNNHTGSVVTPTIPLQSPIHASFVRSSSPNFNIRNSNRSSCSPNKVLSNHKPNTIPSNTTPTTPSYTIRSPTTSSVTTTNSSSTTSSTTTKSKQSSRARMNVVQQRKHKFEQPSQSQPYPKNTSDTSGYKDQSYAHQEQGTTAWELNPSGQYQKIAIVQLQPPQTHRSVAPKKTLWDLP